MKKNTKPVRKMNGKIKGLTRRPYETHESFEARKKGFSNEKILPLTGTKTYYTNFEVRPKGNHNEIYSPNGYSKHMERWTAFKDGKIKFPEQIYGMAQALDHISELRRSVTKGKNTLANAKFEVVEVLIVKTAYQTEK